ncbi:MAG: ferritin-like fold-containing protein [Nitriliruptoraceae bacterium]
MTDTTHAPTPDDLERATAELLGALAYGQLRAIEAAARLIAVAPDAETATLAADVVAHELGAYRELEADLTRRTDGPIAIMDAMKPHFDAYFDRAPLDDWFGASVFFALGLPIAADFAGAVAPVLDGPTGALVLQAIGGREELEEAAVERLRAQLVGDEATAQARQLAGDLLGRALTSYQEAMGETDALKVLFAGAAQAEGTSAEAQVKRLAMEVLTGHRRRTVTLGLEDLDDED